MQKAFYRGRRQILVGFRFNMIWPAGLLLPAGRVCSWDGLTLTIHLLHFLFRNRQMSAHIDATAALADNKR